MDKLDKIIDMQIKLRNLVYDRFNVNVDKRELLLNDTRAIIHEVIEEERELKYKLWSKNKDVDWDKAKEEAIDVFFFTIQNLINLGMDGDEIFERYKKKWFVNVERQKSGY